MANIITYVVVCYGDVYSSSCSASVCTNKLHEQLTFDYWMKLNSGFTIFVRFLY